ncbi:MAG: hypothetical protein IKZ05_02365, partial [Clostridia bacterium]|nr:hypothetical protein [Clostridia bacterium]
MKKIALLLALLLVFSVMTTACKNNGEENSDVSADASSDVSASTNSVKTGISVSADAKSTIVSTGASYTSSYKADDNYPDTYGTELTDGIRTAQVTDNYADETLSGYSTSGGRVRVVIDLGYLCDKLYLFKVGYLATTTAGINAPGSVTVHASIDGKKWENLGLMKKPEFTEGRMQEAYLQLDEYIQARYIRFYINASSAWMFIDEIMAIADVEGVDFNVEYLEAVNSAYQQLG